MKKQILFLLCAISFLLSCQKESTSFEDEDKKAEISKETSEISDTTAETPLDRKEQFIRRVLNACLRGEKSVDVADLNISEEKKVQGMDYLYASDVEYKIFYDEFKLRYPYFFHLNIDEYSRKYNPDKPSQVKEYILDYLAIADLEQKHQEIERSLEAYFSDLQEGMSQADIAYAIHNRLVKEVAYEQSGYPFHALGALTQKKAVCQGYSLAYRLIMSLLGIETHIVISGILPNESVAHAWNRIKIDGQWYNVDATWDDDPGKVPFTLGKYFLTSDTKFHNSENHPRALNLYQIPMANSTRFDDENTAFFRNNQNQTDAIFYNGFWYFIDKNTKKLCRAKIGETIQEIHQFSDKMYKVELRFAARKDKIYFVDSDNARYSIFSVDYNGQNFKKEKDLKVDEVMTASLELGSDKSQNFGGVALRLEVALAKFKDAYYHGSEDFFKPENSQRVTLLNTIQKAEDLLKQPVINQSEAKSLYQKLHQLRKSYAMPFSMKK